MLTLILAAGNQDRWNAEDYQYPTPKQLVPICGQPLLERTIAQLRAYPTDVILVTHSPELARTYKRTFDPSPGNRWTVETLLSTESLWAARTTVLLGDVVYSPWGLHRILTNPEPLAFFGREDLRHRPFGKYYELFGMCFDIRAKTKLMQGIHKTLERLDAGKLTAGKLRELYEYAAGLPIGRYCHEQILFYGIDDWTEDFDTPEDYQAFAAVAIERGWCNAIN